MPQGKFNRVLLDAIDGGLSSLGNSPKEAIFYHLESSSRLKKESIPLNLLEFQQALERTFGRRAYLEKLIIRCFYEGLGLEEPERVDLMVCVHDAKRRARGEEVKQYG